MCHAQHPCLQSRKTFYEHFRAAFLEDTQNNTPKQDACTPQQLTLPEACTLFSEADCQDYSGEEGEEECWELAGPGPAIKRNQMDYVDHDLGFSKVHGLNEDMLLQPLYEEENLNNSEYEEDTDYDNEEYIWNYEYAYYSEYEDHYESDYKKVLRSAS